MFKHSIGRRSEPPYTMESQSICLGVGMLARKLGPVEPQILLRHELHKGSCNDKIVNNGSNGRE